MKYVPPLKIRLSLWYKISVSNRLILYLGMYLYISLIIISYNYNDSRKYYSHA